jgi:hypothetical protein
MRLIRLALQLWITTACAAGTASPPAGEPTAPASPSPAPPPWTLKETEARLLDDVARRKPAQREGRLVAVYYISDQGAADLLSDWFRRQEGVSKASLSSTDGRTRVSGVGTREAGVLTVGEEEWWELVVEGPVTMLRPNDVTAWVRLLRAAPTDARWRLGPSFVAEP